MSKIVNMNIHQSNVTSRLIVEFDHQMYDSFDSEENMTEEEKMSNSILDAYSVTELFKRIDEVISTNDISAKYDTFMLEGEIFAEKAGGLHIKYNQNISERIIDKYREKIVIDFETRADDSPPYNKLLKAMVLSIKKGDAVSL